MAYADDGAGPPIVLVHGWAAHGGFFESLHARLTRNHRVLTPTLRAHGQSGQGDAPLTIETLADDIAHFVAALELRGVVALGWSMGAMALWAAAPKIGPRLAGVIVEDMAPRLTNDDAWREGLSGGYSQHDVAGTLSDIKADWPAYVARFAPRMFAPSVRVQRPRLVDWTAQEMSRADPDAMAAFWASMSAQDFCGALQTFTPPMLIIHGAESQIYPDGATAFIARSAPNAERVVIPGAGHVPHLEAPSAFVEQVEAFARAARQRDFSEGGLVQ
jgi:pimeloyl-ACP methyl ester carboxylesterase